MNEPTDRNPRTELIAGLRELADWYEQHPDAAMPAYPHILHSVGGDDDEAGMAEVSRMAWLLNVDATDDGHHYVAERRFGGLSLRVYYVTREEPTHVVRISVNDGAYLVKCDAGDLYSVAPTLDAARLTRDEHQAGAR